jgi:hypothetical protein
MGSWVRTSIVVGEAQGTATEDHARVVDTGRLTLGPRHYQQAVLVASTTTHSTPR